MKIITTGIEIPIERDDKTVGEIRFDPTDVVFAERVFDLIAHFEVAKENYKQRAEILDAKTETDQYGLPKNTREWFQFQRDICTDMHREIDAVFGEGTSKMVFGGSLSMDAVMQFFDGITPYLEKAQGDRVKKYTNREQRRGVLKK